MSGNIAGERAGKSGPKKPAGIQQLVNWYFGNFCARCGRFDMEEENYGRNCLEKIQSICNAIKTPEMTHAEFVRIIRNCPFCRPTRRIHPDCPVCRALRVPQGH